MSQPSLAITAPKPLYNYAYIPNLEMALSSLASLAHKEDWDYKQNPTGRMPILGNYIHHTFAKLKTEGKVVIEADSSAFNTGLVTDNQEEIFGYFTKNRNVRSTKEWYFVGWKKASDNDLMKFARLPEVANYFENPADLIYDIRCELRINIDHIITDNISRFPFSLASMENYQLGRLLQGTIDDAKNRVKRNYKTAIPQYYSGKIQLLLPVCLSSKSKADLALAIGKEGDVYRASTCLTLDMAMNNARLIAKPDDEWLRP